MLSVWKSSICNRNEGSQNGKSDKDEIACVLCDMGARLLLAQVKSLEDAAHKLPSKEWRLISPYEWRSRFQLSSNHLSIYFFFPV